MTDTIRPPEGDGNKVTNKRHTAWEKQEKPYKWRDDEDKLEELSYKHKWELLMEYLNGRIEHLKEIEQDKIIGHLAAGREATKSRVIHEKTIEIANRIDNDMLKRLADERGLILNLNGMETRTTEMKLHVRAGELAKLNVEFVIVPPSLNMNDLKWYKESMDFCKALGESFVIDFKLNSEKVDFRSYPLVYRHQHGHILGSVNLLKDYEEAYKYDNHIAYIYQFSLDEKGNITPCYVSNLPESTEVVKNE